jgi:hypothetical protein
MGIIVFSLDSKPDRDPKGQKKVGLVPRYLHTLQSARHFAPLTKFISRYPSLHYTQGKNMRDSIMQLPVNLSRISRMASR